MFHFIGNSDEAFVHLAEMLVHLIELQVYLFHHLLLISQHLIESPGDNIKSLVNLHTWVWLFLLKEGTQYLCAYEDNCA